MERAIPDGERSIGGGPCSRWPERIIRARARRGARVPPGPALPQPSGRRPAVGSNKKWRIFWFDPGAPFRPPPDLAPLSRRGKAQPATDPQERRMATRFQTRALSIAVLGIALIPMLSATT